MDTRHYLCHFDGRRWVELAPPSPEPPVHVAAGLDGWWMTSGSELWRYDAAGAGRWRSRPLPVKAREARGIWPAPEGRLWVAAGPVIWSDRAGDAIYEVGFELGESDQAIPLLRTAPRASIER